MPDFKCLGVILDSHLTFEMHVKKIVCAVTPQLTNFKFIQIQLSMEAAKGFLHSLIFSHFTYYIISWSTYKCTKNIRQTRASSRGDCAAQFRGTDFGFSAFSVRAVNNWNNFTINIRQCPSFKQWKLHLKARLKMSSRNIFFS